MGLELCPGSAASTDATVLPDGRKLVTLLDAATSTTKLLKNEADTLNGKPRSRV
jgi:hypothetical protein